MQGDPHGGAFDASGPLLDVRPLMSSSCSLHAKDGRDKLRECSRSLEACRQARFQGHSLRGRTLHENVCSLSSRHLNARGGRSQIKREIIMLEPRAAWAAGVAHNPPLDRQASRHQCLPVLCWFSRISYVCSSIFLWAGGPFYMRFCVYSCGPASIPARFIRRFECNLTGRRRRRPVLYAFLDS